MDFSSNYKCRNNIERIELTPWFYYDIIKTKKRIIHAPSPALKKVQRLILRKCFKPYCKFKGGQETASVHCNKKWLLKLDIKDFYNSITKETIWDIINMYIDKSIETLNIDSENLRMSYVEQIFSMCTIDGKLPTGAPTSPYIANLILREFDLYIEEFCRKFDVAYSRYMDDLFFSTNEPQYILSFVELEVLKQFKELGFEINVNKIKYISSNKRQQVLGLEVNNNKPVLTKNDKRKYRAYFYNQISPLQYNKKKNYEAHERELLGHLAYIKSVDKEYYIRIAFYIFNLLVRFNLQKKAYLKKLVRTISTTFPYRNK